MARGNPGLLDGPDPFLIEFCLILSRHGLGCPQAQTPDFSAMGVGMNRRSFGRLMLGAAILAPLASPALATETDSSLIELIKSRHSVRRYLKTPITDAEVETMLRCAMQAPSAVNEQPWEFVVIRDKNILEKIANANQYAKFARVAPLAILLCMDTQKDRAHGMAILDMGMCAENLMLAATALGIGSVFTGIYPAADRMTSYRAICGLPGHITPIGLIVLGRPTSAPHEPQVRYNADAVHLNTWKGKFPG